MGRSDDILSVVQGRARIAAVRDTGLLDTPVEEEFDRLTRLAAKLTGAPITFTSLVSGDRDFYKSSFGFPEPLASEREIYGTTFCHYALVSDGPLVIDSTVDHPTYRHVPTVTSLGVQAYLGVPLINAAGHAIGSFCAIDLKPRKWTPLDVEVMQELGASTMREIELRSSLRNLEAEQRRLGVLLQEAPDAMVVVNQCGEIVLLNVQAEKQFGYRRDELVGRQVSNIIPEGFAERLIADGTRSAADVLAQQIGTGIELSALRKDGTVFPIEIMLSPLESDEGILVTAAIRDISVRKDAEKHLAQMEGRYRGLLEAAPDAMVVVNQRGEIVLLNVQAEKQFGYRRDELVGQKVTNIIPEGFAERLIADGTRSAAEALAQHIGTGIELSARRKDGTEFPIEMMLSPLESDEGVLVTAAIRDISVRKDVEKHLAQMEGRYRGLLEAAPDAMVVVNEREEIVLLNVQAEKQFGYRRDELVGQQVRNIIPEGFAERLIADGLRSPADALAQQIDTGIELTGRRKDSSEFPIEIMLSPLQSDEGILVTAAIRDITDRKRSEGSLHEKNTELERAIQAKDRFLASMSHELRTPLNGIIGFAEFLADGKPGFVNEKQTEYLGDILTSGRHLLQLINDMLDMVQVQAGKLKLTAEAFRIQAAMEEVFAGVRPLAENKRIRMGMSIAPDLDFVVLDQQRFRQILYNLLSNAIKFTDDGGEVSVDAVFDGRDRFTIAVCDTGIGIKAGDLHRLFTEFEQLETGTSRRFGGTGLGLALTREIVTMQGGDITVESEIGKGSTFTVALPIVMTGETP